MFKYWLILLILLVNILRLSAQSTSDNCIKSTEGKEFWFGFMENRLGFGCLTPIPENYLEVTVTSRFNCQFSISVGKSASAFVSDVLLPNVPKKIRIDRTTAEPFGSENIEVKALHLASDRPLNLYAMNYGYNSADAAVIFPVEALGNEYYALCYEPHVDLRYSFCGPFFNGKNSEFVVVASEDQTQVTITPSKVTDHLRPANIPFTITLNKGELYQVQSMNMPNLPGQGDLTGSFIKSDKPVALYAGSWATTVPNTSVSAWDHLYEQIPPLRSWGRKFVTVPLKTRGKDTYRILASVDKTTVKIANKTTIVIDQGKFYEFMLNENEPSLIECDHPVLLVQYSNSNDVDRPPSIPQGGAWDGDPSMLIISPVDQTRENVTFVAYDTPEIASKLFVNVVTKDDAVNQIQLDNNPISFTSLPNSGYSYAQVQISIGNHNLSCLEAGKGFIAYVYGFGGVESYGYGVGFNLSTRLDLGGDIHFVKDTIVLCGGESKILDAGSHFSSFLWNTGETTQKISVDNEGFYEVTASTSDGCVLKDGIYALASSPVLNLGGDTTVCQNKSFFLDAGGGFTSYLWSNKEITQKISPQTTGKYAVYASNKYGCYRKDSIQINFTAIPKLNLSELDTLVCGSKTTAVNITASEGSYLLKSTDSTVFINGLSVTVPQFGSYPFTFKVVNQFACSADTTFKIGFHKIPSVNFNITDTACYVTPLLANYFGDAEIEFAKFIWVFANDTLASGIAKDKVQLLINRDQKNRKLYLQVEDNGCINYHEINEIKIAPTVSFSVSDTLVCEQNEVKFSASTSETVKNYYWNWGDGSNEYLGKDASHQYHKSGHYDVQLTITTDNKCSNTIKKSNVIFVAPIPTVEFSMKEDQCLKAGVQNLFYTGTGDELAKYNWDLSGFQPSELIKDPGYSIGPLVFDLKSKPKTQIGLQVISKYGCSSEIKQLQLQRKPDFSVHASNITGCAPLFLELKASTNDSIDQVEYAWDFGNGETGYGTPIFYTYLLPKQAYDLKIIAESKTTGCRDTLFKSQWVNVLAQPKAIFSVQNTQQCLTDPFVFKAFDNGTGVQYYWDWGDSTKATGITAQHRYGLEGHFDVSLTVTSNQGCTDKFVAKQKVFAAPIPTIGFSIDPATCMAPGPKSLNYVGAATNMDKFYWDLSRLDPEEVLQSPGNTSGPLIFDLINKPSAGISLQVVSQYGCKSENRMLIVRRKPVYSFVSDVKEGCTPLKIEFTAKSGDPVDRIDYHWNFGDGGSLLGQNVSHIYLLPDQYYDLSIKAVSNATGCSDSLEAKKYVLVHPNPTAGFSVDPEMVYNDQSQVSLFDQSKDAVRFEWAFGDGTRSVLKNPLHKYESVGIRRILQTVYNQFNCSDTISKNLTVALRKVFTPNAFTPNAINLIDREFKPFSNGVMERGYHLKILSRWNDVVFECKNEIKGWNGKLSNGTFAQPGNYIWILEFTDFLGKAHRQMGTVMLVY